MKTFFPYLSVKIVPKIMRTFLDRSIENVFSVPDEALFWEDDARLDRGIPSKRKYNMVLKVHNDFRFKPRASLANSVAKEV